MAGTSGEFEFNWFPEFYMTFPDCGNSLFNSDPLDSFITFGSMFTPKVSTCKFLLFNVQVLEAEFRKYPY